MPHRTTRHEAVRVVATASLLVPALLLAQPRNDGYDRLTALFREWRAFAEPARVGGVPDASPEAMARQRDGLAKFQRTLATIRPDEWSVPRQIDYALVRAEMNGMEFDHRVLRPWARNPSFYTVVHAGDTDVPRREGPAHYAAIDLWTYRLPLGGSQLEELRRALRVIPAFLAQGKRNLVEDARDLWWLGAREKRQESAALAGFARRVKDHHPELTSDLDTAIAAIDEFAAWLDQKQGSMTAKSGVGIEQYDWYVRNVHLVPYTWAEQVAIMRRELARAWAHLKLEEQRNRHLPPLEMPASAGDYHARFTAAVADFIAFLRTKEIFTVPDYAEPALLEREGRFVSPDRLRDFFTQIEYRDARPMRAHGTHWIDRARMTREPHPSLIRRVPLLYNIWDTRAEGLATGFEEMVMTAGYLDDRPRARELVWVMLAQRAARALGDLMMHAGRWDVEKAVTFAVDNTPYGWLPRNGDTVWGEQHLYLEQPSYGTSYLVGKIQIEDLLRTRARQLGDRFTLRQFMDDFHAAGMMPVSMIGWEMTGERTF
jgi:hypothetical protein